MLLLRTTPPAAREEEVELGERAELVVLLLVGGTVDWTGAGAGVATAASSLLSLLVGRRTADERGVTLLTVLGPNGR